MVQALAKKMKKNKAGFTLIELIVVIAILGILAAILIPSVTAYIGNARQGTANADARSVYTAAAAAVAANPDKKYTDYDSVESDLAPYLGTPNFTINTITFNSNGDVTSVNITDGGITVTYPKSGS